jgi:hypothetical protein
VPALPSVAATRKDFFWAERIELINEQHVIPFVGAMAAGSD